MQKIYESQISDKKWMTLGLLSDLGWIAYFAGFALYLINGADGLGTVIISATFLLNCLCVLAVFAGIIELISQRVRKLDRTLKRSQLVTGFGFCVYGAFAGFLFSGASAVIDLVFGYETAIMPCRARHNGGGRNGVLCLRAADHAFIQINSLM